MDRITEKQLDALCLRLNRLTHSPETPYTDGKANIGNFHISHAYGGVCLHRMYNAGGGITTPLNACHAPKRELYAALHAFLDGIEFGQEMQARTADLAV